MLLIVEMLWAVKSKCGILGWSWPRAWTVRVVLAALWTCCLTTVSFDTVDITMTLCQCCAYYYSISLFRQTMKEAFSTGDYERGISTADPNLMLLSDRVRRVIET